MNETVTDISHDLEFEYLMKSTEASISKHILDEHFTLVAANNRYYEMFGYEKDEYEALYQNRPDLYYTKDPQDWKELSDIVTKAVIENKKRYDVVVRMRHKNGTKLWIKLVGNLTDEYVNGYRVSYSVMTDITDLMQVHIEQEATQNNFPGLIAKYRITKEGCICLYGNENYHEFFKNKTYIYLHEMNEENGLSDALKAHEVLRTGKAFSFTISPRNKKGKRNHFNINAECIDWIDDDPIFLLIYTDITKLIQQQKELQKYNESLLKLAYSDELTKGFNRRKFDQKATATIQNKPPATYDMIWFNIQKFKVINDVGGVEAGDKTLIYVHDKIKQHLGNDEYIARLFSDNFVILMKSDSEELTRYRLEDIAVDINSYNLDAKYKYYLTFTAGIYHVTDLNVSIVYMEDRAHAARKHIEVHNNDLCSCSFYNEEILEGMLYEKKLENRMRDALNDGEFEVYLQPKVSLKSNQIAGAEALIRWNDPKKGLISPADFIPLFEKNGFVVDLDLFVFKKVCELQKKWIDEGKSPIPISVNMSRVHFTRSDFLKEYISLSEHYSVDKKYLEIELTETMIFENPKAFSNIIHEIHKAGFPCSMDDFGSGYSTLNTLKDLNVDVLKLDGAFFSSKTMDNERENIIIRSVVGMAKSLEITTVAEGIETLKQVDFLRETNCDLVQGYVFAKPIPIPEFEKILDVNL